MKYMRALGIMHEITGKIAPGKNPAYTPAHVLIGLELIGADLGIGRQQLSRKLRLGEGTIRTMVSRLRSLELVSISRGGMNLTEKGRELLAEVESIFSVSGLPESPITIGSENYAVLVKRASTKVRLGIEQRDAAMIVGAEGATTLVLDEKGLRMPSMVNALDAPLKELILRKLKPVSGDVVIIGSSDDPFLAELGAKSAALELVHER